MADLPEPDQSPDPTVPATPLPVGDRSHVFESGEDVVLSFEVGDYEAFDDVAITDPAELAKMTRPPGTS